MCTIVTHHCSPMLVMLSPHSSVKMDPKTISFYSKHYLLHGEHVDKMLQSIITHKSKQVETVGFLMTQLNDIILVFPKPGQSV